MLEVYRKLRQRTFAFFALMALAGCATITPPASTTYCEGFGLLIDTGFSGGNVAACSIVDARTATVTIRPEDPPPINQSAWYAFRLSTTDAREISIEVSFVDGYARYWPKISDDGQRWTRAREADVAFAEDGSSFTVRVDSCTPSVWVSAQEIVTTDYYAEWTNEMAARPHVTTRLLSRSVEGRPIHVAQTPDRPEAIFLIGRQHPPEVSGALAMRAFVDTVLADSELARRFRDRYSVVVIPLINPDGIERGHWRHNVNGLDLNRDWGPFSQPETRGAKRMLDSLEANGVRPALMLDFHSTRDSLFYTQLPEESSWAIDFATVWFERFRKRRPDFSFKHDARARSTQPNTKNYFFDRYRVPAITYEIGDEEDRDAIATTTPVFAEEMMRLLLEYDAEQQTVNRDSSIANDGRPAPIALP